MKESRQKEISKIEKAYSRGEFACVIELAEKYLEQYPDSARVLITYGKSLTVFHRYADAEQAIRKVISITDKLSPEYLHIPYNALASIFEGSGNFVEAAKWYRMAHQADPQEASYLIFIGVMHFKSGKLAEAEQSLRAALTCRDGAFDEAYFNLGSVLVARGRLEEAVECYKKAIELDPKYKEANVRLKDTVKALSNKHIDG